MDYSRPLIPFLATGGEFMGLVVGIISLAVSTLIYAPFVIASNRAAENNKKLRKQTQVYKNNL